MNACQIDRIRPQINNNWKAQTFEFQTLNSEMQGILEAKGLWPMSLETHMILSF